MPIKNKMKTEVINTIVKCIGYTSRNIKRRSQKYGDDPNLLFLYHEVTEIWTPIFEFPYEGVNHMARYPIASDTKDFEIGSTYNASVRRKEDMTFEIVNIKK